MWKELKQLWSKDTLLSEAWNMTYEAISIDFEMFDAAVNNFWGKNDKEVQQLIYKKDKLVNKYERDIRRKVVIHVSVQGGQSIVAGLVLTTVIVDVERIGDYIKNIVDLTKMLPKELRACEVDETIHEIEKVIKNMFTVVPKCLEDGDVNLAVEKFIETKEVGKTCDEYIKKLISEENSDLQCSSVAAFVLYFRYLKRINAHLRNIISSVVNPYDRIGYKPRKKDL